MEKKLKVALIAHDRKKDDLLKFIKENERSFAAFDLVATRMTGIKLMKKTGLKIESFDSGTRGGDQEIGVLIARGELDAVFFFRDLLTAKPSEPDMNTLPRLCDVYNLPIATNLASAKGILAYLKEELVEVKSVKKIESKDDKVPVYQNAEIDLDYFEEASQETDRQKDGVASSEISKEKETAPLVMKGYRNFDVNIDHLEPISEVSQSDEVIEEPIEEPIEKLSPKELSHKIDDLNDPLIKEVLAYIYENQKASALLLQLKFRMTSKKAMGFIKVLESQGLIGPMEGNKPRVVLMTEEQYQELIS